jgi:hypothetical protein
MPSTTSVKSFSTSPPTVTSDSAMDSPSEKAELTMEPETDAVSSFWALRPAFMTFVRCFWLLRWLLWAFSLKYVFWQTVHDFSNDAFAAVAAASALFARTFSVKISEERGGREATRRLRL